MVWSVGFSGQDSPLLIFLKIHLCMSPTGTKPRSACVSQAVPQCGSEAVDPSDGDAPCTGCSGTWSSSLCLFGCPSFEAEALLSVLREVLCSRERGSHVLRLLGWGRLGRDPLSSAIGGIADPQPLPLGLCSRCGSSRRRSGCGCRCHVPPAEPRPGALVCAGSCPPAGSSAASCRAL